MKENTTVKRVMLLIFDGLGDRPIMELGNRTPLEAAYKPNLNYIAGKSICGLQNALGRGMTPGSDVSHLAVFGYPMEDYYHGRGPLEALGIGIDLQPGDVAFRGNFGTVFEATPENIGLMGELNDEEKADYLEKCRIADEIEGKKWMIKDRRAGRISDVRVFAEALDGMEIDGVRVLVKPGTLHRAGVVFRGKGLSSKITNADPHEAKRTVMEVKPADDSEEAKFTACVINKFMRRSYDVLNNMEENKVLRLPANFLLVRGAGIYAPVPSFAERYGFKACCIAGGGLYKGIGRLLGMDVNEKIEGLTANKETNVRNKLVAAKKALEEGYNFVFVHVKATDSLAEDGNWLEKKQFIEKCDVALEELTDLPDDVMLVITADHSTACALKAHTADPVPILFCNSQVRIDDVSEFSERACAKGGLGRMTGADVMPEIMNIMGKLHLWGA